MSTAARVFSEARFHWYYNDGKPCYELPKKDGSGVKTPTIADARKLNLLPGVSTILKCSSKPFLEAWKTEQAVLAALTTPRLKNEALDAFIKRVLSVERVQEQESEVAKRVGRNIHENIEVVLQGKPCPKDMKVFVEPTVALIRELGTVRFTEKILVGDEYGGRADLVLENDQSITLLDYKTCKKLPKEQYEEHKLQLSAYAPLLGNTGDKRICAGNLYISKEEPGKVALFFDDDWPSTFNQGFVPLLKFWQWRNNFYPRGRGGEEAGVIRNPAGTTNP